MNYSQKNTVLTGFDKYEICMILARIIMMILIILLKSDYLQK